MTPIRSISGTRTGSHKRAGQGLGASIAACVVAASLLGTSGLLQAAPNQKTPDGYFSARRQETNQKLHARCMELDGLIRGVLADCQEKLKQGNLNKVNILDVGKAYAGALELSYIGKQLIPLGEIAGVDFYERGSRYASAMQEIVGKYRDLPGMRERIRSTFNQSKEQAQKNFAQIPRASKLASADKWEEAEKVLREAYLSNVSLAILHENELNAFFHKDFQEPNKLLQAKMEQLRAEQAQADYQQQRATLQPDYAALLERLKTATAEIRANGVASVDGKGLTTAQLLDYAQQQWLALHHRSMQSLALDWSFGKASGTESDPQLAGFLSETENFHQQMIQAIADILNAEAQWQPAQFTADQYAQIVNQLAKVATLSGDVRLQAAVASPLNNLEQSNSETAQQVESYRLATEDLLRWRSRLAAVQAGKKIEATPPLADQLKRVVLPSEQSPGLVAESKEELDQLLLNSAAQPVLETMIDGLLGETAVARNVTGLDDSHRVGISRYGSRCYVQIAYPAEYQRLLDAVAADLFASETYLPRTLTAAIALQTARRGDLIACQGELVGLQLEGLTTRFVNLKSAAWCIIPLGSLPGQEKLAKQPAREVLVQLKLRPKQFWHRYYYLELP